jgi:two-component system phosphate regulon response regulator PhoB
MSTRQILIIEDEADVVDLISLSLRTGGQFGVCIATDGINGLRIARQKLPALIILDLMLPDMSGFEICRLLKSDDATKSIPILILSAKASADDRICGLELGADDYVTKPFSPREVAMRVRAMAQSNPRDVVELGEVTAGAIAISGSRHEVQAGSRRVSLTAIEFKLLTHLIKTRGRVQSRELLLREVWDYASSITTRTVDAHIQRLRKKLGLFSDSIETVRSYGYRFRN